MADAMQSKVSVELQGRVFATITFISTISESVGQLTVGLVVDKIFEPTMAEGGALAPILGPIIGVGYGRGMGVIFL